VEAPSPEHGLEAQDILEPVIIILVMDIMVIIIIIIVIITIIIIRDAGLVSYSQSYAMLFPAFGSDEFDACICQVGEAPAVSIHQPPVSIVRQQLHHCHVHPCHSALPVERAGTTGVKARCGWVPGSTDWRSLREAVWLADIGGAHVSRESCMQQ
jgi:hypothetical protein